MKKLISISLVLVLAGGLLLSGNTKAEAMNNESAALLTASLVLIGLPVINAITYDHYGPSPIYAGAYYADSYPVPATVIYTAPRYERYGGRHYWRGNRFGRDHYAHHGYEGRRYYYDRHDRDDRD